MTRDLNKYLMGSIAVIFMTTSIALGQVNTGTIAGTVEDPSGASIPHAQLQATNELTGQTRTAASNDVGYYAFTLSPIGRYNITVTAKGFKATVRKGLALSAGQTLSLDLKLEVGATTEKVTVSGAPSRLNYTSPEQIETLGSAAVHQLPLANQDWSQLLKLGTGIANAQGAVTGLYEAAVSSIQNDSNADARLDDYLNPDNQITLRVTRARPFEFSPRVIAINGRDYAGHNDGYNAQFTHSSGNWTTATRFGYNRVTENRLDQGFGVGLDQVIFGGLDSVGAENFNILGGIETWQEDVAITHGKHTLEFGGIVQRGRSRLARG